MATRRSPTNPLGDPEAAPPILSHPEPRLAVDEENLKIWQANCLDSGKVIERSSVDLVFTSPPYPGVPQPEEEYVTFRDPLDFNSFHDFLRDVWQVCYDLLADSGRLVVNIYDIPTGGEVGMYPNVARVVRDCLGIGFIKREDFIWHKGASYSPPTGSFPLPKGVLTANTYENNIVFQKPIQFKQRRKNPADYPAEIRAKSTLGKVEHGWLMDPVWKIKADTEARKLGHPFPFPRELPERFIKLYTMYGDSVFDPFVGSGTTALAAQKLGRMGLGTELADKYIAMLTKRTDQGSMF
jgi:DNA modification methylase